MANRNNAKVNADVSEDNDDLIGDEMVNETVVDEKDDVDDIPDELDLDAPQTAGNRSSAERATASSSGGLSLDELDAQGFNMGKAEDERKRLDNPTGDWEKKDRWEFEKRVYAGDCMPGDMDPAGRTSFSFKGKPKPRHENGISYEPTLFLTVSPDYRADEYNPGAADGAYKRFLYALDLYLDIKGEACKGPRYLISMLENDEYVVRTANYDGNTRIVGMKKETGVQRRRR